MFAPEHVGGGGWGVIDRRHVIPSLLNNLIMGTFLSKDLTHIHYIQGFYKLKNIVQIGAFLGGNLTDNMGSFSVNNLTLNMGGGHFR